MQTKTTVCDTEKKSKGMNWKKIRGKLAKSKFRSGFSLSDDDRDYIEERGMKIIRVHAEDFLRRRIAPRDPKNDGKQTPMRGHPVFNAQHATATCCRGCINEWYGIPEGRKLGEQEVDDLAAVIMGWIGEQV